MHLTTLLLLPLLPLCLTQSTPSQSPNATTPYTSRHIITLPQALSVIAGATAAAATVNPASNIAITDPSGFLVAFNRLENAFLASIDISLKKAKTVALFNGAFTTAGLYNASQPGASLYGEFIPLALGLVFGEAVANGGDGIGIEETNQVLVVFGGGVPIFVGGYFIGAIGVSGGTVDQDIEIAK